MAVVAAAIIGGAAISAISTNAAASSASDATAGAAASAADATIQSTQMQIEEISRQYDNQMQILQPQIQLQYNSQRAYTDLLGIGGNELGGTPEQQQQLKAERNAARAELKRLSALQDEMKAADKNAGVAQPNLRYKTQTKGKDEGWYDGNKLISSNSRGNRPSGYGPAAEMSSIGKARQREMDDLESQISGLKEKINNPQATMPGPGGTGVRDFLGSDGFRDPNLNPASLADNETLTDTVQGNLLAGTDPDADPYRNYINERQLQDGAAGTGVYGDVFQESAGYEFQREEMERSLQNVGSRGGPNIGGRAIMEAQRRAQGLADSEYYKWAGGRERDLVRQAGAEQTDVMRGDQAYQNYLGRKQGDATRLDSAARSRDAYASTDLQRQDQSYYNYLNAVQTSAGFGGGPAAQAVNASQNAASSNVNAYGNQGTQLSNIFQTQGVNEANIGIGEAQGYNNAIQGGISNYFSASQAGML